MYAYVKQKILYGLSSVEDKVNNKENSIFHFNK